MDRFYAVCPHCEKSIFVEGEPTGTCACSACGQTLILSDLRASGCAIDFETAEAEYARAQDYFANNDFKEARTHFCRVLDANRNHYFAYYYAGLCDVYENESRPDYDYPGQLIAVIVGSVRKTELCRANLQNRIEFLQAALRQVHILLTAYFNRMYENFEKTELWDVLRDKCLGISAAVCELVHLDKEQLMAFDPIIAKTLVDLSDLAICACCKTVQAHLRNETQLDLPTDYCYEHAKSHYDVLLYYATSLDANYNAGGYKPDYTDNLLCNQSVAQKLKTYDESNKSSARRYLSTKGEELASFRKAAATAVRYSYHACFKSLAADWNEKARIALVNDSVGFCFELLMPRFFVDPEKKIASDVKTYREAKELGGMTGEFLREFAAYNRKLAIDYARRFFTRVHDTVKTQFGAVYAVYARMTDKLKETRDAEYRYYKNFLHTAIYACSVALSDVLPFDEGAQAERGKTLRLGKQIAEEFLLLNDYNVEELEQSVKYADVLDIYNALDDEIAALP